MFVLYNIEISSKRDRREREREREKDSDKVVVIFYLVVGISRISPPNHHHSNQESHHQSHTSEGDSDVHVLVLRHLHPPD